MSFSFNDCSSCAVLICCSSRSFSAFAFVASSFCSSSSFFSFSSVAAAAGAPFAAFAP